MITHYFRTIKDTELKQVTEVRAGVWTHVIAPTNEESETVVKQYALDEAILADAQDFFEVPRLERSNSVSYFFVRYPVDGKEYESDTAPLLIVVGESFIVTLALFEVPQFKQFIEGKTTVYTTQKAKFFIQILVLDSITKSYERELIRFRKSVQRDRTRLRRIGSREIERLVDSEDALNEIITALIPTHLWLQQVTNGNYMQLYNDDMELMNDLMIANSQLVDSARSVLKSIQNIRSATEAILTNRLNFSIRTLTVLTIVLTLPTIIASLYGMNVPLPLEHNAHAFIMILGFIVVVVAAVIGIFKKYKWL